LLWTRSTRKRKGEELRVERGSRGRRNALVVAVCERVEERRRMMRRGG